jgi:hypothetical protein
MFEAFNAFVVAEGANGIPPVLETVVAHDPALVVASPVSAGSKPHPKAPVSLEAARDVIQAGFA